MMPSIRIYIKICCAISIVSLCFLSVELQGKHFSKPFCPILSSWTYEADGPGAFPAHARGERGSPHCSAVLESSVAYLPGLSGGGQEVLGSLPGLVWHLVLPFKEAYCLGASCPELRQQPDLSAEVAKAACAPHRVADCKVSIFQYSLRMSQARLS